MAITKLNSLAIPPDTVVESDISFPLDSASFTGDLTVDTDTLVVDSTNNRVGIAESTPLAGLHVKDDDYVKVIVQDVSGADTPFSLGSGANAFTISNNGLADTNDEAITLHSVNQAVMIYTAGSEQLVIDSNGNLTLPNGNLSDVGTITSRGVFLGTSSTGEGTPTYSFDGDTDTGMFHQAANKIGFATGGTTRLEITAQGDVVIPQNAGDFQTSRFKQDANNELDFDYDGGLLGTGTNKTLLTSISDITMLSNSNGGGGGTYGWYTGDIASATQLMALETTGRLSLYTGNLRILGSGNGIDFSTTTQASGMTSEVLDDYEEGTWTPAVSSGATVNSYTTQSAAYVKIGRLVHIRFYIQGNITATNQSLYLSGLPFNYPSNTLGYSWLASGQFGGNMVSSSDGIVIQATNNLIRSTNLRTSVNGGTAATIEGVATYYTDA